MLIFAENHFCVGTVFEVQYSMHLIRMLFCRHKSIAPTADSSFLSEFYSHSRLHFLSTWKTELTEYVRYSL